MSFNKCINPIRSCEYMNTLTEDCKLSSGERSDCCPENRLNMLVQKHTKSSLEKGNIRFVCLNEAICPIIPQRLADQKAKIRELIKNTRDNVTQRDSAQFVLIRLLREFDEAKL